MELEPVKLNRRAAVTALTTISASRIDSLGPRRGTLDIRKVCPGAGRFVSSSIMCQPP